MIIKLKEHGTHLGTRHEGMAVRRIIADTLARNDKVIFDLEGVEIMSNSFADECFAKLLLNHSLDQIKSSTHFINGSPFIRTIIANSFKVRLSKESLSPSN